METRKIGLIPGTGKQSKGIALRLGMAGYSVMIGSRTKEKALATAKELNEKINKEIFSADDNKHVATECNLIFLVLPSEYLLETIKDLKDYFQPGTIIVDVMVPLIFEDGYMQCAHDTMKSSISEILQSMLSDDIPIVGAFKTVSANILGNVSMQLNLDIFVTSDVKQAKQEVMELITNIEGCRPVDAGPLKNSRTTEQMTALVININKLNKLKHASYKIISSK